MLGVEGMAVLRLWVVVQWFGGERRGGNGISGGGAGLHLDATAMRGVAWHLKAHEELTCIFPKL